MMRHRAAFLIALVAVASAANSEPASPAVSPARSSSTPAVARPTVHQLPPDTYAPSMAEVAKTAAPRVSTPQEALERLKLGNARFYSGETETDRSSVNVRRAQIMTQTPFAVVLGCSDSRVPIEIVFDQGLGDIFSIRVAGNIADAATLGSVEYAVNHLNARILVVMGHEGCGAVAAAMLPVADQQKEAANVQYLLKAVAPSVKSIPAIRDRKSRMREAVIANVRSQVAKLRQNPVVAAAIESGKVQLVGGFYEISSGAVDFLETEEELAVETSAATTGAH